MPRGCGFILLSFNIFINDLEEGVNSTLVIITSDAKLGFVACTTGRGTEPLEGSSLDQANGTKENIAAHGCGGSKSSGSKEAPKQGSYLKSFLEQPKVFTINHIARGLEGVGCRSRRWHQEIRYKPGWHGSVAELWHINQEVLVRFLIRVYVGL